MFSPSPQQAAIFDWVENGSGSAVIEAVAGAGKTTTLVKSLLKTKGDVAFCAFNKSISEEIEEKVKPTGLGNRVKVATIHSFGFSAVRGSYPKTKKVENKLETIAKEFITKKYILAFVVKCASMAKQTGIGITSTIDDMVAWTSMVYHHSLQDSLPKYVNLNEAILTAVELLKRSNSRCAEIIDFDDMVYIPVLKKLPCRQYDWVFVDEAQDTNVVRRELVKMLLRPEGRLVAVGDSRQAIYGFTGADYRSMDNIAEEFNATRLPLTITYRCPKKVVAVANQWVSHIQAADSAPDGVVDFATIEELIQKGELKEDAAVLCRVTRPLVSLAFRLINHGIPCKVEGRKIGTGLVKIVKKMKVDRVGDLLAKLEIWYNKEIRFAVEREDNSRCEYVEDQISTLKVLIDQCDLDDGLQPLYDLIDFLFGDTEGSKKVLTLSTIHRAKGREWNRVFVLGMDSYSPCKWASKPWEMVQEENLMYVQVTRAKSHLTMIPA